MTQTKYALCPRGEFSTIVKNYFDDNNIPYEYVHWRKIRDGVLGITLQEAAQEIAIFNIYGHNEIAPCAFIGPIDTKQLLQIAIEEKLFDKCSNNNHIAVCPKTVAEQYVKTLKTNNINHTVYTKDQILSGQSPIDIKQINNLYTDYYAQYINQPFYVIKSYMTTSHLYDYATKQGWLTCQ